MDEQKLFGKDWWRIAYVVRKKQTILWILCITSYEIVFDDNYVVATAKTREDADRLCAILNGAYNLGRSNMRLEIETL